MESANLDDTLTFVNRRNKVFMNPIESFNQSHVTAIAQTDPDQSSLVTRSVREEEKILVLADQHPLLTDAPCPKLQVARLVEAQVDGVRAFMPASAEENGQGGRELIVDEEFHAVLSTTWSVCCAAYVIAATMSSRSKKG